VATEVEPFQHTIETSGNLVEGKDYYGRGDKEKEDKQ
jgi:hypothetical protein